MGSNNVRAEEDNVHAPRVLIGINLLTDFFLTILSTKIYRGSAMFQAWLSAGNTKSNKI